MADVDALPDADGEIRDDSRPGRRILCHRRYAAILAPVFDDPDSWFDRVTAADSLKHDRTTTVIRVALSGVSFHFKRYNTKNAWHGFRRLFRRSRAMNCWTMTHRFRTAGIPTAPPAAMIQERWGPFRLRSYFVTESVPGARLPDALRENPQAAPALARRMSEIFHALARHRLSHGDFKATNILVTAEGLCLLDLDAASHHLLAATQRRAWRNDRARLLRNFAADPAFRKTFANAVPERLPSIIEH